MKKTPILTLLPAGALAFGFVVAGLRADDKTAKPDDPANAEAAAFDTAAVAQGDVKVTETIASKFAKFAGSDANASALVTGLRTGGEITLTSAAAGSSGNATFKPATGAMGFGNVYIALDLAREELAKQGIKNPTPAQIQAALNGGSVTTGAGTDAQTIQMSGVLALRAQGQGWGEIARTLDVRIGRVVTDLHSETRHIEKTTKPLEPTGRPSTPEKPEAANRPERPERPERFERPSHGPGGR